MYAVRNRVTGKFLRFLSGSLNRSFRKVFYSLQRKNPSWTDAQLLDATNQEMYGAEINEAMIYASVGGIKHSFYAKGTLPPYIEIVPVQITVA